MKRLNPYWKARQKNYWIHTVLFGCVCMLTGWYLHGKFLENPTALKFIAPLFAAGLALWKLYQSLFYERK